MPKPTQKTYQLKVTLTGSKPPIWRRILVPSDITLGRLHDVLQIAMGWTDSHLHQFEHEGRPYGVPEPGWDFEPVSDEQRARLDRLLRGEKDWLRYEYDFGDGWVHRVTLEKTLSFDDRLTLPRCIKGKGACPPEDIGGIWGYYAALQAYNDPQHPEHREYRELFAGDDLDPNAFDIGEVNALLSTYFQGRR
jgi:hypothetical protein